jgi:hypothetical protein
VVNPNTAGYPTIVWYGGTSFSSATLVTLTANTTVNFRL